MTTDPTTTPEPRRRWLQYSLRTLLALMLVIGCGLAWFAHKIQQAWAQREAVKAIEELEGLVSYEDVSSSTRRTTVVWVGKLLGEDLSGDVLYVDLSETQVTDAGLKHLRGLTQLQVLTLDSTQVTDAGLEHLRGLTQLRELQLTNTQVTDAGLGHLRGLTQLQWLSLDRTQVTDAGLEHLRGLTQLQQLYLDNTQVADAGLEHLQGLTQLQLLSLQSSQVTDAGVAELQKALPNVQINR
jgi:Leucine-rich repeat (LRR) protein